MNPIRLYFDFIEPYSQFIIRTLLPLKDMCVRTWCKSRIPCTWNRKNDNKQYDNVNDTDSNPEMSSTNNYDISNSFKFFNSLASIVNMTTY